MRARNIKPGFFRNDELATIGPYGQLLFAGLWCMADREGRLEDRPLRIKADIFPYYQDVDVDSLLESLHSHGFILRYIVQGSHYIQVCNWKKHQFPHHKEADSTIPTPEQPRESPGKAPGSPRENPPDSLIPDSLIPDSHTESISTVEEEGKPSEPTVCVPEPQQPYVIPKRRPIALDGKTLPSERFEEFWRRWPNKVQRVEAEMAWCDLVGAGAEGPVFECLTAFEQSDQWARGVYGLAHNWLYRCARNGWKDRPAKARDRPQKTGVEEIVARWRKEGKLAG